jgi:hypothetical protein
MLTVREIWNSVVAGFSLRSHRRLLLKRSAEERVFFDANNCEMNNPLNPPYLKGEEFFSSPYDKGRLGGVIHVSFSSSFMRPIFKLSVLK